MRYVYCHPLFDERKCAHRFSYELSESFKRNHQVLERFDYRGTGEADGDFSDVTITSLTRDLEEITDNQKVCLIGTRLGASVAFEYCCKNGNNVQALVLIGPVINGRDYANYLFRKQKFKDLLTGNKNAEKRVSNYCNLEGYKTSKLFIDQIREIRLLLKAQEYKFKTRVYIIQISPYKREERDFNLLARYLNDSETTSRFEVFNLSLFWERVPDGDYQNLNQKIIEWCG